MLAATGSGRVNAFVYSFFCCWSLWVGRQGIYTYLFALPLPLTSEHHSMLESSQFLLLLEKAYYVLNGLVCPSSFEYALMCITPIRA